MNLFIWICVICFIMLGIIFTLSLTVTASNSNKELVLMDNGDILQDDYVILNKNTATIEDYINAYKYFKINTEIGNGTVSGFSKRG